MIDINKHWYRRSLTLLTMVLVPLSWLYFLIIRIRRALYRFGWLQNTKFNVPVIVVGNITVGGTGKTPFIVWLAQLLKDQGYRPGIVSRGYGGQNNKLPCQVTASSDPVMVGDEPVLLAQRTHCPVVVCADRVAAVRTLLNNSSCNIVLSDDGLQHYRLARDLEIVLLDSERGLGNGFLLPAGPLRETATRLNEVDVVVQHGDVGDMQLQADAIIAIAHPEMRYELANFPNKKIHAVAGVGNPRRFFNMLESYGFVVTPHVYPDHYPYSQHNIDFQDNLPVVMTEKDAVKCAQFATEKCWYVNVNAKISDQLTNKLLQKINLLGVHHDAETDFTRPTCRVFNRRDGV